MNPDQNPQISKNTAMAVIAYIGPLVIVSYLVAKSDSFVKFHIKQGLVLFIIEIVVWLLSSVWWSFWPILNIVNIATLVLSIIGIVNAVKGNEKMLPLVGSWSNNFKF